MPDYTKGKIYKIVCNVTGLMYIGSTCVPTLARRLAEHKSSYKRFLNGEITNKLSSFEVLSNDNYNIILIENVICQNKDELYSHERKYIETIECVNINIPGRTSKQYYNENKEHKKEYREENKDHIKEYMLEYHEIHHQQLKDYNIAYNQENKAKIKVYRLKYEEENKEMLKEKRRLKRLKNKLIMEI
jgi:hypothetical protein